MKYQTRHLEALEDVLHGGRYLTKGDTFFATEVDSDYLERTGRAKRAEGEQDAQAPLAAPRRRGRPPAVKVEAESPQEPEADA